MVKLWMSKRRTHFLEEKLRKDLLDWTEALKEEDLNETRVRAFKLFVGARVPLPFSIPPSYL